MVFRGKIYCVNRERVILLEYRLTLNLHEWDDYRLHDFIDVGPRCEASTMIYADVFKITGSTLSPEQIAPHKMF